MSSMRETFNILLYFPHRKIISLSCSGNILAQSKMNMQLLTNHRLDRCSNVIYVTRVQTSDTHPPVLGHVHMVNIPQNFHLLCSQAGITKHANLTGEMIPFTRHLKLLQSFSQSTSHRSDSTSHGLQILAPDRLELLIGEDRGDYTCTKRRRRRDCYWLSTEVSRMVARVITAIRG